MILRGKNGPRPSAWVDGPWMRMTTPGSIAACARFNAPLHTRPAMPDDWLLPLKGERA